MSKGPIDIERLPRRTSHRRSTGEPLGELADLGAAFGLEQARVSYEVLPPGRRTAPPHRHTRTEEMVLVLEGEVTVTLGATQWSLGPKMASGFPAGGAAHTVENRGAIPARLLSIAWVDPADAVGFAGPEATGSADD